MTNPSSLRRQPIDRVIGSSLPLSQLRDRCHWLSKLQLTVDENLPPGLSGRVHIANVENSRCVLVVRGATEAATLRYCGQELRDALNRVHKLNVNQSVIKIDPRLV